MRGKLLSLSLLGWVALAAAAPAPTWQYPRTYAPAPDAFVLTAVAASGSQQQYRVAPAGVGACTRIPGASADDFCTVLACPPPDSIIAYWVHAVWGQKTSTPSNIATCWFKPDDPTCGCQNPEDRPLPSERPQPPTSTPPLTMPPLVTTPPPRPQQSAEGLNLLPIGTLPTLP